MRAAAAGTCSFLMTIFAKLGERRAHPHIADLLMRLDFNGHFARTLHGSASSVPVEAA